MAPEKKYNPRPSNMPRVQRPMIPWDANKPLPRASFGKQNLSYEDWAPLMRRHLEESAAQHRREVAYVEDQLVRFGGLVQAVAGFLGAAASLPVIWTPLGLAGYASGSDVFAAGAQTMYYGRPTPTYASQGAQYLAKEAGASPQVQQMIGGAVEGLQGGFSASVGPMITRLATAAELRTLLAASQGEMTVYVVKGGIVTPVRLIQSTTPTPIPGLTGFSVQCEPGVSVLDLAKQLPAPYGKISVTTVEQLEALGYKVVIGTPGKGAYHSTVQVPYPLPQSEAEKISTVFIVQPNPAKK